MPDSRLTRTRDTLPSGYQFGDAKRIDPLELCPIRLFPPYPNWLRDYILDEQARNIQAQRFGCRVENP